MNPEGARPRVRISIERFRDVEAKYCCSARLLWSGCLEKSGCQVGSGWRCRCAELEHAGRHLAVKPLYTKADLAGLEYADTLPGFAPYLRGPQADDVRGAGRGPSASTPASPPPRRPTRSTARRWPPAVRAFRSPSTWRRTAATTPIIRASPATSARPAWRSTRSRT